MAPPIRDAADSHKQNDAILVTGGSGFIGRSVVTQLAQSNNTVVCMYHHRLPEPMANVYPVCSDISSTELIAAPLRGVDTVIHLAWEDNFIGPTDKVSWRINSDRPPKNVRIIKNLLTAMEKAGTRRIIFLSAIGASKDAKIPFLQEKYLAEFFVLNAKIPEKVILRSSVVCGGGNAGGDRFLRSIVRIMKYPVVYPVPNAKANIAPLHIKDLVKIICDITKVNLNSESVLLEVTGQETYRMDELFKLVSTRFVKGAKFPLKGILGNSLVPLFEREKRNPSQIDAKLKHFLSIGNEVNELTHQDNPLNHLLPNEFHSFKDVLAENQSF